ncbi:hypothetical protein SORBI_3004G003600 [Sorghum bicolor]|nr:hypothetical protein SORBI_3004G003600 [Sorghum bicolor]
MKTLDVCGNIPPLLASHTPPSYPLLASALFLPWLLLSLRRRRLYAPSSVAHDLPRRRRSRRPPSPAPMRPPAGGPLPGGCACADLRSHLVAAPARPPSGGPCVAPRRCYKPRCRCTLAAGSSLAFHGHGKPHEHHGHDEPTRRRLVRLSLNCGNMIEVLMVAIFVSDKRFSCPSKSYELCVVQANVLVL